MKTKTILSIIGLFAIVAFIALNWNVIMMPTSLSFGIATIQAPLGFMMLALLTTFTTLFLALILYTRTSQSTKEDKHAEKIQENKELTGNSQNLQLTELQTFIELELKGQKEIFSNSIEALMQRLQQIENKMHTTVRS